MTRPARVSTGGMWSMPWMRPFAIDGAAPRMTTNVIASSDSLNSRMASGNQAIDGMVCRPVISDPIAARRIAKRLTSAPTPTPMTTARPKPQSPRRRVIPIACQSVTVWSSAHRRASTSPGPGRTYWGRQPVMTTACQSSSTMPTASTFGHVPAHVRRAQDARAPTGASSASRPATWASASVVRRRRRTSAAMAGNLLAQAGGHERGERGDIGILDAAGPRDVHARTPRRHARAGW